MSDCNIAHYVYDFNTSQNIFPKTVEIVTHYLIFMRNPDPDQPKEIKITDQDNNTIFKLEILWHDNYGQVKFDGKYLNLIKLYQLGYSIKDELSDNYRIFTQGILASVGDRQNLQNLQNQDLFININNEQFDIITIQDDHTSFNAINLDHLKSFKLSMGGHIRVQMTKTALEAYKMFVNPNFFILGNKPIKLPKHPQHPLKNLFDKHGIEFESVVRY